ncbi:Ras-related protein Rab-10 [Serendipita indica DSM 11827]|nr:Ras-related protein Rab-10 [Serendipita indica DSM 11827]
MHDQFELAYNLRVGCDLGIKTIEISGHDARIIIWDIAGHERFHTITARYYRDVEAIALVYDITSRQSYRNLAYKVKNIHTLARPDTTVVLIGTKADCEPLRQVSSDEGRMFAAEHGKTFLETSALETESDRDNVHTEFMTILTG